MCPLPTEVPEEPEPPTLDYNEQLEREDYEDCTVPAGRRGGPLGSTGLEGGGEGLSTPPPPRTPKVSATPLFCP